jgi:penicillin-binding protein 1C
MRDNWCIGYSTRYTVGVWVGNFDGESMHDVSGVTGAAPVWAEVMQYLHRGAAYNAPSPPANVVTSSVQFEPPLEAGRAEYFLRGTETERIALNVGARRKPRILYPGRGMIIALDPDIPGDRQRVFFSMEPANASLFWQLDGRTFGGTTYGWQPQRGEHTLRLVDASGEMLDQVRFIVRGRSL